MDNESLEKLKYAILARQNHNYSARMNIEVRIRPFVSFISENLEKPEILMLIEILEEGCGLTPRKEVVRENIDLYLNEIVEVHRKAWNSFVELGKSQGIYQLEEVMELVGVKKDLDWATGKIKVLRDRCKYLKNMHADMRQYYIMEIERLKKLNKQSFLRFQDKCRELERIKNEHTNNATTEG